MTAAFLSTPGPSGAGPTVPEPVVPAGLPDPAELAQLAQAFFRALPGEATSPAGAPAQAGVPLQPPASASSLVLPSTRVLPHGIQPSLDFAPPGSPLASPAGLGPNVPGTPIPQGTVPGANLLPATPDRLPPLAHRIPARLPHAAAGNGLPDVLVTEAPAFLPRSGGAALGVPEASGAQAATAAATPVPALSDPLADLAGLVEVELRQPARHEGTDPVQVLPRPIAPAAGVGLGRDAAA